MSQQILLLGAPALLGLIATVWSIRLTFAVMLPATAAGDLPRQIPCTPSGGGAVAA